MVQAGAHNNVNMNLLMSHTRAHSICSVPTPGDTLLAMQMGCDDGVLLAVGCNRRIMMPDEEGHGEDQVGRTCWLPACKTSSRGQLVGDLHVHAW